MNVIPYRTNAELAVLAARFVETNERQLLFRIYVPANRLWATEADKLLSMFRDWMSRAKGVRIRQDGYSTGNGRVYEFFGDGSLHASDLPGELQRFSDFLDLALTDPEAAIRVIEIQHLNRRTVTEMVTRFGKEARRLRLDVRQEYQSRVLSIKHCLESELLEIELDPVMLRSLIDQAMPHQPANLADVVVGTHFIATTPLSVGTPTVVNNWVIGTVNGVVAAEVNGSVSTGVEVDQMMRLIGEHAVGRRRIELESAVNELGDVDAGPADRIAARQQLKGFLLRLGDKVSDGAIAIAQKFVEAQIGP